LAAAEVSWQGKPQPGSMATKLENRCPICLDSWEEASYVMPCLHPFCCPCILQWAESKPACPLCKRKPLKGRGDGHS
uniref:RING-type E3 ubiquitin transferase n=1 Tax=Accipiter nisus TaxID=211598 RepID=A0A8B9MZM9_9AVES